MTMIAIACAADRAVLMTDTLAYTSNVAKVGHTSKFLVIPHLDAAVLAQGDGLFGDAAKVKLLAAAYAFSGLDTLLEVVPELLEEALEWRLGLDGPTPANDCAVFLVGYSDQAQRFVAYGFDSATDFQPFDLGETFAHPMPWDSKPSPLELARFRKDWPQPSEVALNVLAEQVDPEALEEFLATTSQANAVLDEWEQELPLERPGTLGDWITLATKIRYTRATIGFCKVLVGGRVFLTMLRRDGSIENMKLLDFDDDGEQLADMVAGTEHPLAQVAPCACGSGKRYLDCCLTDRLDKPCTCGADLPFRECCMVRDDAPQTAEPGSVENESTPAA